MCDSNAASARLVCLVSYSSSTGGYLSFEKAKIWSRGSLFRRLLCERHSPSPCWSWRPAWAASTCPMAVLLRRTRRCSICSRHRSRTAAAAQHQSLSLFVAWASQGDAANVSRACSSVQLRVGERESRRRCRKPARLFRAMRSFLRWRNAMAVQSEPHSSHWSDREYV